MSKTRIEIVRELLKGTTKSVVVNRLVASHTPQMAWAAAKSGKHLGEPRVTTPCCNP